MDLCLDLCIENYSRFLLPTRRNTVLLELSFSLNPFFQADTPGKQCCNFSRNSSAFETDKDMYISVSAALRWWFKLKLKITALSGVVYNVKSTGPSTAPLSLNLFNFEGLVTIF